MKRKIAKLVAPKKFEIFEEEIQPLEEHDVLLRLISSGFCHSEMPEYQGLSAIKRMEDGSRAMETDLVFPRTIGHEPVGIVEDIGKGVDRCKVGDIVGGPIGGAFATHIVVNSLTGAFAKIPPDTTDVKYCLVEPLGCCANIVRAANPELGNYVAVIGCGIMGLLCISGLARSGAFEIIAIDLMDSRLDLAEKFGATVKLNPSKLDVEEAVLDTTGGYGMDVVVEITGRIAGFSLACKIIRSNKAHYSVYKGAPGRGKILIPSLYAKPEIMDAGYDLMFKAPIIHSTHPWYSMNLHEDLEKGIECYRRGIFPLGELITHEFPLEEIGKGFDLMERAGDGYLKGIVAF
jgi:threonine dehydrogenase-like Zn-dependent dehydrogenase